jgi:hypothetical protein
MLRAGDIVLDRHAQGARRKIHKIKIVRNTKGQTYGLARYALTVTNLKSPGTTTIIFVSENTGPSRFDLPVANAEEPT